MLGMKASRRAWVLSGKSYVRGARVGEVQRSSRKDDSENTLGHLAYTSSFWLVLYDSADTGTMRAWFALGELTRLSDWTWFQSSDFDMPSQWQLTAV